MRIIVGTMHLPPPAAAFRGTLLVLLAKLTSIPTLRDLVLKRLLVETRIRELPEEW